MSKSINHTEQKLLFSIIIPARNEEKRLPRCLKALKISLNSYGTEDYEVIVVLNRCEDKTEEVARGENCRVVSSDAKNLATIRNAGASHARGEILVTVDADSLVSENLFTRIHAAMSNQNAIGGGVMIYPDRWSLGIALTALCLVPIALWYGISGGVFFCRTTDFHNIGGFNQELSSVEDIDFAKRLKAYGKSHGKKFMNLFRAYIITSTRKFDTFGDWYFLRHPGILLKLLKGNNQELANKVWYDYRE